MARPVSAPTTSAPRPPAMYSKPPGFAAGFSSMFQAAAFLAQRPATWPVALVPMVLFATLLVVGAFFGGTLLTDVVMGWFSEPDSWYATAGQWIATVLVWLISLVAGLVLSLLLTPPLSAPALEHLVATQERALGVPKGDSKGFIAELWCGLRAQALALLFATPILLLLWIINLAFPPAAIITLPLKVLVLALAVSWNLFDYPLTLRGVSMGERLSFFANHLHAVLGFGVAFAALFWIPCCGVLMLPVGVVAATRLIWSILEQDHDELALLPRPQPTNFQVIAPETKDPERVSSTNA